ncbi:MAG: AAA family ATPase, partial [Exiguobacterium sp.]|nr:AAA family ATPase [Exiguobacterium sp.]
VKALVDTLSTAKETPIEGMLNLADIEYIDPTTIPRIKSMIPALDEAINGFAESEITVLTGESSGGKSTICGTFLLNAIEQGRSVCAYSGELSPSRFREWLDLQAAGSEYITLKYDPIKNKKIPVVFPPAAERIHQWYDGKFFLYENVDDEKDSISESILRVFTMAAKRKGCSMFLVDNMMTALMDAEEEENRAQAKFVAQLKRFAVRYNSHVLIVAHPRKTKVGTTIGKDDVGGSKYITNLASNVLLISKPDITVLKSRDSGITKFIECAYCGDSRRVYQLSVGDKYNYSWDKAGLTPPSVLARSLPEYGIYMSQTQMF